MSNNRTYNIADKPYFENLYGLRFFAALAVFIFHAFSLFRENWIGLEDSTLYSIITKITDKGSLGVNLFFVLSGFLITYLLLWEKKEFGKVNALQFIKRRTLRIWPVYFLVILFGFFVFPNLPIGQELIYDLNYYLGFASNFNEIQVGAQDSLNFMTPPWSVSIEEQFYIALAIILGIFSMIKWKGLLGIYTLVILGSLLFRYFNLENERVIYFHTFSVMSDIAVGGIIAILAFRNKIQKLFVEMPRWMIISLDIIGFGIILGKNIIFRGELLVFERLIISLFFAFIILEQVYSKHSIAALDKNKWVKRGGEISYGFYMYHVIVMYFVVELFSSFGFNSQIHFYCIYLPSIFITTTTLAYFSYNCFEKFFLKFK